jgi:hypothetical protein
LGLFRRKRYLLVRDPVVAARTRKWGLGLLLFFRWLIFGAPAAILSLHLHGDEWFGSFKRPKR